MMGKLLFGNVGGDRTEATPSQVQSGRIVHPELRRICEVRKILHFVQDRRGTLKLEPSANFDNLITGHGR
jgi:hypothetical protein